MSILGRLFYAGRTHAVVTELTRDPDPAPTHEYDRDPASGAGNCRCGGGERDHRHPHEYVEAAGIGSPGGNPQRLCTCALPRDAKCHR